MKYTYGYLHLGDLVIHVRHEHLAIGAIAIIAVIWVICSMISDKRKEKERYSIRTIKDYKNIHQFLQTNLPSKARHIEKKAVIKSVISTNKNPNKIERNDLVKECLRAHQKGYFFVFNTMTVKNNDDLDTCFDGGIDSAAFTLYIQNLNSQIAGGYHRYFAVIERGPITHRLHFHVLHILQRLPRGSKDPNEYCRTPINREIESFRPFWWYGDSVPMAVRYQNGDAFSKRAWNMPVYYEEKEKKFVKYPYKTFKSVIKYITKDCDKNYDRRVGDTSYQFKNAA